MSEKLEKTLKRIDKVFEYAKKEGMVFGENKPGEKERRSRLSDRTYESYQRAIKGLMNHMHEKYGVTDIEKMKERYVYDYFNEKVEGYKNGTESAFTARKMAHAIEAFKQASIASGQFKYAPRLGSKEVVLEKILTENKVFRKSSESTSLKATNDDCAKVKETILTLNSPNKEEVYKVISAQHAYGGRISATLRLTAGDIGFNKDGTCTVNVRSDKGGLSRSVLVTNPSDVKLFERLTDGKKSGTPLFQIKSREGNDKNVKSASYQVQKLVESAAKKAGVNRGGQTFNTHSFRKNFAQNRYDEYRNLSAKALQQEVEKKLENPVAKAKYNSLKKHVTSRRKDKELNDKELAVWLTSVDIGHFRMNVMSFYINK